MMTISTLSSQEAIPRESQWPVKGHKVLNNLCRKDGRVEKQDEGAEIVGQAHSLRKELKCQH